MRKFFHILRLSIFSEFPSCYNETFIEDYCGASDCPSFDTELARNQSSCGDEIVTSDNVEKDTVYLLMGIYAAIGLLGAFITGFFVDPIQLRYLFHKYSN